MVKNLEQGKPNQKNYQIIEQILKKRNKRAERFVCAGGLHCETGVSGMADICRDFMVKKTEEIIMNII